MSNRAYGRMVVAASREVFGPVPPAIAPAISGIAPLTIAEHPPAAPVALTNGQTRAAPGATRVIAAARVTAAAHITGKYRPLFDYLSESSGTERVEIGFADIDALVTGGLPKSASTRPWWGNTRSSRQARAWLAAGFDVTGVDLGARTVCFEKRRD